MGCVTRPRQNLFQSSPAMDFVTKLHSSLADMALSALQDQTHEAAEHKAQQEQDCKTSAETKSTIPAMWRPIA